MELGQVKIAVGINPDILKGIVSSLYDKETIPHAFEFGSIHIEIAEPHIEIRSTGSQPRIGLSFTGGFKNGADPAVPFSLWLRLAPFVRTISGSTPVAALSVSTVEDAQPPGIGGLVGAFATGQINSILQQMDIPIYDSLIGGLENAVFGDTPPARSTWNADFYLGATSEIEQVRVGFPPGHPDQPRIDGSTMLPTTPSLIATLAIPGESASIPGNPSIVPDHTGIQVVISRSAMDAVMNASASAKVGTEVDGVSIKSMSMQMHDLGIHIRGSAEKSDATITWDGILLLFFSKFYRHVNGSLRWHDGFVNVFASGINVDVDIPWYIKLLRVFLFIIGPIGWVLDVALVAPKVKEADKAPDLVKGAFRQEIGAALSKMISNVGGFGTDDVPFMQFGQNAWVLKGHYCYSMLAFAGLNRDTIASIEKDKFEVEGAHGASVGMFTLNSGYELHPEELGRLMVKDIVQIPNAHGVKAPYGYYVRTNPNDTFDDNFIKPSEIVKDS